MSSVLPQPAEEVLERRRDGLQHPREDVEEAPRALLATAAAVVAVAVLLPAALAALLVPLVFDLPLLLRVRVVDDDLCGRSCVWLSGFTYMQIRKVKMFRQDNLESRVSSLVGGNGDRSGPGRPRVERDGGRGRRPRALAVRGGVPDDAATHAAHRAEAEHELRWRLELPLTRVNLKIFKAN